MKKFLSKNNYKSFLKKFFYAKYELHYVLSYYDGYSPSFDLFFTILEICQIISFPLSSEV
jgi:hypothetical protein